MESLQSAPQKSELRLFRFVWYSFIVLIIIGAFLYLGIKFIDTPDSLFPISTDIVVANGMTQREIAKLLEKNHAVRSSLFLDLILRYRYTDSVIQAGVYQFTTPHTTLEIAEAITHGSNKSPFITVMIPEGFRARDIYNFLPEKIKKIYDIDLKQYEGTLFPDTYFISPETKLHDFITRLQETFKEKLKPYEESIAQSGFTVNEIITLASIIEREARDTTSKRMVSGILQNRLKINMPLQVDATLDYILDKASHELTVDDLRIDSPYNTYRHIGLPPTPISNPGLESIEAVLEPIQSQYVYYLTGTDDMFYYAKTFEEHKRNKEQYLR